jgi:hypothetical protein
MKTISDIRLSDLVLKDIFKASFIAIVDTLKYEYGLYVFLYQNKKYKAIDVYDDDKWAKVQIYSLALIFKLWEKNHYRSKSFKQDLIDNLKNIAIPGTGVPLSLFCCHWIVGLIFVAFLNPFICFIGAINKAWAVSSDVNELMIKVFEFYSQHLLHPDDWFSFWRLNCRLVSLHSYLQAKHLENLSFESPMNTTLSLSSESSGYLQENKWHFLTTGKELGVPVSPFITNIKSLVCKNVNIEGGMGIHFFKVSSTINSSSQYFHNVVYYMYIHVHHIF